MKRQAWLAAAFSLGLATTAQAQGIKLPTTLTLTAYETGSNAFNQAVAVGQMLKNRHGTDLRVLPAGNDVARLGPLRSGRAQLTSTGIGMYFAQEGVLELLSPAGRVALRRELARGTAVARVELSGLPAGLYFWRLLGRGGRVEAAGRLVKGE